jgi:ATP-dependent Clp protease ATP-binding subunit ClpX
MLSKTGNVLRCSFCHKDAGSVTKLISSPDDKFGRAYICNDCVAVCQSILEGEEKGGLSVPTTMHQQALAQ